MRGQLDDAGREASDLRLGGARVGGAAGDERDLGEIGADAAVAGAVRRLGGREEEERGRGVEVEKVRGKKREKV